MKHLLVLLFVLVSLLSYSQEKEKRFAKYFEQADVSFDSVFYDKVQEIYLSAANQESGILDPQKLTITMDVNDFLDIYFIGYLRATEDYEKNGKCDFRELLMDLIEMRQAFKQRYNFQHGKFNWPE